jgi:hypothetical protein
MTTITISFDLVVLYLVAANVIAILSYVLVLKQRAQRAQQDITRISAAILDYFRHSEVEINVECISRLGGKRFIAIIDSPPLKRFRYSHIVETALCSHIEKSCGVILEKVYWRFPINLPADALTAIQNATGEVLSPDGQDDYINERLLQQKAQVEYSVVPATWTQFEEAVNDLAHKPSQAEKPDET